MYITLFRVFFLSMIFFFYLGLSAFSQAEKEKKEIYSIVDEMPRFPGGEVALQRFIAEHVIYPAIGCEVSIKGKVFVRFSIMEDGCVDNVYVARSLGHFFDEEALRVVKSLPVWIAGKKDGKRVPVWYTVPVNFQLAE